MADDFRGGLSWAWYHARFWGAVRDAFRALWALLYWNALKTAYVLRRRKGPAPCQHRHDVQDGVRPRCLAVWNWDSPGRFQRICPALVRTTEGWRCSVAAAQVKPFWGRALAVYGLLAAILYVGATGGLWVLWQKVGYHDVSYVDVAWPGNWSRVKPARADYFRQQGRVALMNGDLPAALLALSTAEQLAGGNYEARLLLARLWVQAGNVDQAGRFYDGIMTDFPGRAAEAAVVWHDQLIASGQLTPLADLCVQRLISGGASESLWEFSLTFALEHGRSAGAMTRDRRSEFARLPVRIRGLIDTLAHWQRGENEEAVRLLTSMRFSGGEPLAVRRQIEWLAGLGQTADAGIVLTRHAGMLGRFEAAALRYHIDMAAGDRDAARANFVALLQGPLTPGQADRLCALIITWRDGESLRRIPGFFALDSLNSHAPSQAAFWTAALACELPALADAARERYKGASGGGVLPVLPRINFRNHNPADHESPLFIAGFVPLPRETIYALIGAGASAHSTR